MSTGPKRKEAPTEPLKRAIGLTLRLWIDPAAPAPDRACCAPASVRSARDLCHAHGMPHIALDLRDAFRDAVVEPFVAGYAAGETPNPCATCNGAFRFDALDRIATRLGCVEWRTGHYAFDATVHKGLGLDEEDELVGFIYLGQLAGRHKPLPSRDPADFVERWS